jgi:hypothetical protein
MSKTMKIELKGPVTVFKLLHGRQNIAFWTNAVSHLHHEIRAVNSWLFIIRLIAF